MTTISKDQITALLYDKRREKKMTGEEVVQKLKGYGISISPKTLWGYEKGNCQPPVPTFIALCKIYEIEDIISETKSKPVQASLTVREKMLLDYFRQASPEAQELALKMLKPEEKSIALSAG